LGLKNTQKKLSIYSKKSFFPFKPILRILRHLSLKMHFECNQIFIRKTNKKTIFYFIKQQ
jgi:hypothetical protein